MASIRAERETEHLGHKNTAFDLESYGIKEPARVYWNLTSAELYEEIARRSEGVLSNYGALIVDTGEHTGRAAKDKAIVREPGSEDKVFWGDVNKDFPKDKFNALRDRMMAHATGRDLFVQDTYVGADAKYRLPIRVINELAWHSLFARTMFISNSQNAEPHQPEFTIINFPSFLADPQRDGTRSPTFILMDFSQRLVLIGGTSYAGETKKSGFTLMNYLLPQGLATIATDHHKRMVEKHKARLQEIQNARMAGLRELAAELGRQSVTIEANANDEGHLYGSVGAPEIVAHAKQTFVMLKATPRSFVPEKVTINIRRPLVQRSRIWESGNSP
jgi:ribosomal protein L9